MLSLPTDIACGYCDCSEFGNMQLSPKRKAVKFEIELYLEDGFFTVTDDKSYPVRRDFVHITRPGQIRNSRLPFRTAYIKFRAEKELAERLCAAPAYFCSSHPAAIRDLLDRVILQKDAGRELLLYSALLSLLDLVLSDAEIPAHAGGAGYRAVSEAKRFIEAHAGEPLRLRDIAAAVNLSEIYFHNTFTAFTGRTPHRYLMECRIENAKRLLWNGEIGIAEIAEKTGFCSQQHLHRVFKQLTGSTPGQYRKTLRQAYFSE